GPPRKVVTTPLCGPTEPLRWALPGTLEICAAPHTAEAWAVVVCSSFEASQAGWPWPLNLPSLGKSMSTWVAAGSVEGEEKLAAVAIVSATGAPGSLFGSLVGPPEAVSVWLETLADAIAGSAAKAATVSAAMN